MALKLDRLLEVKTVEREAKVLKRLQPCPCVVRLLEQGAHEQRGFMVMEVWASAVLRNGCEWRGAAASVTRGIGQGCCDNSITGCGTHETLCTHDMTAYHAADRSCWA